MLFFTTILVKRFAKAPENDQVTIAKLTQKLHIGIIMDGNRRWAKNIGKLVSNGHRAGADAAERLIKHASEIGVNQLTLYTLSIENLQRSQIELDALFKLAQEAFERWINDIDGRSIKVSFFGDETLFPESLKPVIQSMESKTSKNSGMRLNILFCYGGDYEIVAAAKKLARKAATGEIDPEGIDKQLFSTFCQTGSIGCPDLIIRTGGHKRLSNFMPFSSVYSEIAFVDKLWPEFTTKDFDVCLADFAQRTRKFGL